jgi:DNA helicase-2/ATP-dependent DNA helicase PcrA
LREIPPEVLQEVRLGGKAHETAKYAPLPLLHAGGGEAHAGDGLGPGQRVKHAKFGTGVVLSREGEGNRARVEVNFQQGGRKWLMLAYANLQPF